MIRTAQARATSPRVLSSEVSKDTGPRRDGEKVGEGWGSWAKLWGLGGRCVKWIGEWSERAPFGGAKARRKTKVWNGHSLIPWFDCGLEFWVSTILLKTIFQELQPLLGAQVGRVMLCSPKSRALQPRRGSQPASVCTDPVLGVGRTQSSPLHACKLPSRVPVTNLFLLYLWLLVCMREPKF